MTESEARGEGLVGDYEKLYAFQTALHALVEDAVALGVPSVRIDIELRKESNRMIDKLLRVAVRSPYTPKT